MLVDIFFYLGVAVLGLLALYIVCRVGSLAVLTSMRQLRSVPPPTKEV